MSCSARGTSACVQSSSASTSSIAPRCRRCISVTHASACASSSSRSPAAAGAPATAAAAALNSVQRRQTSAKSTMRSVVCASLRTASSFCSCTCTSDAADLSVSKDDASTDTMSETVTPPPASCPGAASKRTAGVALLLLLLPLPLPPPPPEALARCAVSRADTSTVWNARACKAACTVSTRTMQSRRSPSPPRYCPHPRKHRLHRPRERDQHEVKTAGRHGL